MHCGMQSPTQASFPMQLSIMKQDALAAQAREIGHADPLPSYPEWLPRLLAFDPRRVVFAHDAAVWVPR